MKLFYTIIIHFTLAFALFGQNDRLPELNLNQDTMRSELPPDFLRENMPQDSLMAADTIKKESMLDSPVKYTSSDSTIVLFENGQQKVLLYKEARVTYGEIELTADFIEMNLQTREIFAQGLTDSSGVTTGKPHFKDQNEEFDCETLRYNFKTQKGIAEKVVTNQQDGIVHSDRAKMISREEFCFVDGKYTTCDAAHPHWYFAINKGKIVNSKSIITGRVHFVLADFPLYFPFLPFGFLPNQTNYASGILMPTYGEEQSRGFYLKNGGFYWAASDYFDVAVRGDIYSKGSWGVNFATNYAKRYKFSGRFNIRYNKNVTGDKGIDQSVSNDFAVSWSHSQSQKANPNRTFSANVNFSTSGFDKNNNYDSYDPNEYLRNSKSSSISYTRKFANTPFSMSMNLRHSQNSADSTISLSLPEMTLNMSKVYPLRNKNRVGKKKFYEDVSFSVSANTRNTISTKESLLLKTPLSDWQNGVRFNVPISLPSFQVFNHINFSPGVSYNERWYFDYLEKQWVDGEYQVDQETGATEWVSGYVEDIWRKGFKRNYEYSFSLSGSTTLYGLYLMKNPESKIKGIRHKVSPSFGFSYHPDFGDTKYGFYQPVQVDSLGNLMTYNIFERAIYGSTSPGESGAISFGLRNNIEMKVENSDTTSKEPTRKIAIFDDLGFSGSYNLVADSFNLSQISWNARTKIAGVNLNINGSMDPYEYLITDPDAAYPTGRRINEFTWNTQEGLAKLGRLTRASFSFGLDFNSEKVRKKREERRKMQEGGEEVESGTDDSEPTFTRNNLGYTDFILPWTFGFNYSFTYSNPRRNPEVIQSLNFRGSLDITDKWKASFTSNFDFKTMQIAHTSISVSRNLHCWNMAFNFSPFGERKFYSFTISADAAMLKDLKINKQTSPYDNAGW